MTDSIAQKIIEVVHSFPALNYRDNPHNLVISHTGGTRISLHVRIWGDTPDVAAEIVLRDLITKLAETTGVAPDLITVQMEKRKPCPNPQIS